MLKYASSDAGDIVSAFTFCNIIEKFTLIRSNFQLSISKNGDLELMIKLTVTVNLSHCTGRAVSSFEKRVL